MSTFSPNAIHPEWKMFNRFSFRCAIERYDVSYYAPFFFEKKNFITQTIESRSLCGNVSTVPSPCFIPLPGWGLVGGGEGNLRWKLKIMLFKMIPSTQLKRERKRSGDIIHQSELFSVLPLQFLSSSWWKNGGGLAKLHRLPSQTVLLIEIHLNLFNVFPFSTATKKPPSERNRFCWCL